VNVGSGSRKIGIRSLAGIGAMALYLGFVAAGR
jgi:hypothetical protein